MHTPKVIIHRLDAPWLRESRRNRLRVQRGLLMAAAAVAGFAVLIGTLAAADDSDITPALHGGVHLQQGNKAQLTAWTTDAARGK